MTISWYSISIFLQGGEGIFNGYFSVNNDNNSIISFYETINGSTNFQNNILVTNLQNYDNLGLATNPVTGYNVYDLYNYNVNNIIINSDVILDNIYGSQNVQYPGFTPFGIGLTSFSYYNISNVNQVYNFSINYYPSQTYQIYISNSQQKVNNLNVNIQQISDPSCFNEGTKILCLNKNFEEEYIPIENLRKGDLVKSYKHGYRKIDLIGKNYMINNPDKFNECMYKMKKTDDNGLIEDLIITGGHSILVDDLEKYKEENYNFLGEVQMIDNKYLLLSAVSNNFTKLENTNLYTYYHFILENNGNDDERFGVWANGILTETSSKKYFMKCKYTLL